MPPPRGGSGEGCSISSKSFTNGLDTNGQTVLDSDSGNREGEEASSLTGDYINIDGVPRFEEPKRAVGMRHLIFMAFFCVSGGSFGLEPVVSAGYPLMALLGLLVIPVIWSLPIAMMTAELASAIPSNGGKVVWAQRSFGPFWGLQSGWWTIINNIVDSALFPVMFIGYLNQLFDWPNNPDLFSDDFWTQLVIKLAVILTVACLNILGIELMGNMMTVFTIIVLSPFVLIGFYGLPQVDNSVFDVPPDGIVEGINWSLYISIIMWNTLGWDTVGAVAGEVEFKNPNIFPRSMIVALILVTVSYVWPLFVSVCTYGRYTDWEVGTYVKVAEQLIGRWFGIYMIICGLVSSFGLLSMRLLASARTTYALALPDLLHSRNLARLHSRFGTPWVGVVVNAIGVALVSLLPFEAIVEVDVVLYSLVLFLSFPALWWLRKSEPNLARPYTIPLTGWKLVLLLCFPPCALGLFSIFLTSWFTIGLSTLVIVIGWIGADILLMRRVRRSPTVYAFRRIIKYCCRDYSKGDFVEFEDEDSG